MMITDGILKNLIKMKNLKTFEDFMSESNSNENLLLEFVSWRDLNAIEKFAERLFKAIGLDVTFTKHFFDRVNDARNGTPISKSELFDIFKRTYNQYKDKISGMEDKVSAIITDTITDINIPFVIQFDKNGDLDFVAKTIMRKRDFKSYEPKLILK